MTVEIVKRVWLATLVVVVGGSGGWTEARAQVPGSELRMLRPFMGTWRADPIGDRAGTFFVNRAETLDGAAIRTLEGVVGPDGEFRLLVDNLTAWNPIEAEVWFQEHASWGNFVRGRVERLGEYAVRRHMTVWNVDGTYNLWWETWTYDPESDSYAAEIRRIVEGKPVEDETFPSMRFRRVSAIPGLS